MELDDQTPQNSPDPATTPPASSDQGSSGASLTKPDWLDDDSLFDPEKGVKLDELGARFKELREKHAEAERLSEERRAATPEKAEDYGITFPEDFKAPDDFQVDENSPLWGVLQKQALARGMTKAEYAAAAADMVTGMAEQHRTQMKALTEFRDGLFKEKLGPQFAERVEAVNKGLTAMFGENVGKQFADAQFTPDITAGLEKMLKALSDQGVSSFNGSGREGDVGKFGEDFGKMSFKQQWASAR